VVVGIGFLFFHERANRTAGSGAGAAPGPTGKVFTFKDKNSNNVSVLIGNFVMNGTNVPLENISVRAK